MNTDIRVREVNGAQSWTDGWCLECGARTYGAPSDTAPPECLTPREEQRGCDYYVWCSNPYCAYYRGECVGDMACPPDWAVHDAAHGGRDPESAQR
jgi:hypothetical protein